MNPVSSVRGAEVGDVRSVLPPAQAAAATTALPCWTHTRLDSVAEYNFLDMSVATRHRLVSPRQYSVVKFYCYRR